MNRETSITLPFLDSMNYSAKLSNMQEKQTPIFISQNASYLYLCRHIADVENVRIIEIYQCYKLSDTKYALSDMILYTVGDQ